MHDKIEHKECFSMAVQRMTEYGQSNRSCPTQEEVSAVEVSLQAACMDAHDNPRLDDYFREPTFSRRLEAMAILRDCIFHCNKHELGKIEKAVMNIAENLPINHNRKSILQ